MTQLSLFDGGPADRVRAAPAASEAVRAAAALSPRVHLGTSSWTFPGWRGLVYESHAALSEATLAREGLAAYAGSPLHRTVGLDRAFYRPMSAEQYRDLAAQTPAGFRFLVKAWQGLTNPEDPAGVFLHAETALDLVLGPALVGLGDRLGPIVFQLSPLDLHPRGRLGGVRALLERVGDFFLALRERVGRGPLLALEWRNVEPYRGGEAAALAEALRRAHVAHGFASHPRQPTLAQQRAAMAAHGWSLESQPALVCRWLLRHDQTYGGAKQRYQPFTRIVDEDAGTRGQIVDLVRTALRMPFDAWVIINNKAEGSAPRSVVRLAESLAASPESGEALGRGAAPPVGA